MHFDRRIDGPVFLCCVMLACLAAALFTRRGRFVIVTLLFLFLNRWCWLFTFLDLNSFSLRFLI